ncbi:ComEC/Rec2 family competence protein [Candidatus Uhrbacteria bacterium]|jgi:competence protein ComEC|nr:ComEC/Rec2 family competence protein [Candidatus Uhrbacteria bacterium]
MTTHRYIQLFLVSWLLIVVTHGLFYRDQWPQMSPMDDTELSGVVNEVVSHKGKSQTFRIEVGEYPGRVQVTTGGYPRVRVGDVVGVRCNLEPIADIYVEEFRYDRYLAKEKVYSVCRGYGSPEILGHDPSLRSKLFGFRDRFEQVMQRNLVEPHASFLAGLLYGARSTLPDDIQEQFRKTGTMHIVAVSGYNVTLVADVLLLILTATFFKRQHAFWFVMVGILMFVIFAGGDPAVVRAGIMGGLVLIAKQLGRLQGTVTIFLIAAAIMTLVNPRVLLDDVGFQLSFAAAIGLVTLGPKIALKLTFIPTFLNARSILSETLAAILATMPISILQFHQFSLVAPVANLLVVPLVSVTMMIGFVSMVIVLIASSLGVSFLGPFIMLPSYALLEVMLNVIETLSPLPFIDFS